MVNPKKGVERRKMVLSREYLNFLLAEQKTKKPRTWYEKLCKFSEKLRISPPKQWETNLQEDIIFSIMNVTPKGVFSAALLTLFITSYFSFTFAYLINDVMIMMILFVLPIGTFYYIYSYPKFHAQVLKVQTGDEAIKIILYMIIYLKLHPSFEGAINFAAAHAEGPISSDIKKVMWDLHVGKYKTVEEAISTYMPKWAVWNEDFVRSLTLIYGVLSEPTEEGREAIQRKSLDFLLTNTHRKMKTYVENISGSINILHIMGMLLPVIGLIMFPMISLFLRQPQYQEDESVLLFNPFYLALGYTIVLPLILLFFMNRILLKRPSAFMVPDVSKHPDLPPPDKFIFKFGGKRHVLPILPVAIMIGLLIMLYGILHFVDLYTSLLIASTEVRKDILMEEADWSITNILSTFSITGGFGVMFFLYFYLRSFQRIKIRNNIKNIESEFQVGLFSLGNYLAEGYPIEKSIQKSLDEYEKLGMQKRPTYHFFSRLLYNIKNFGMTFRRSLFDKKYGILRYFPSVLIGEVMRILSDASEKSSVLLGKISKTIGSYIEDLNTIEAKIRELLEDVRSGIKMQSSFVVPLICAVTGTLGLFILRMLKLLSCQLAQMEENLGLEVLGDATLGFGSLINELVGDFATVMPMTVLQAIVGIYTVEIVTLLALLLNGIENGFDDVSRDDLISKTLLRAIIMYSIVSIFSLLMFNSIIVGIIGSAGEAFVCG